MTGEITRTVSVFSRSLGLMILALMFSPCPASALHEPISVAIGIGPNAHLMNPVIEKHLRHSIRFRLGKRIAPPGPYPWNESLLKTWRSQTSDRVALVGSVKAVGTDVEMAIRIVDLKWGQESKVLYFRGNKQGLDRVAEQIVQQLRVRYPLQAAVTPINESVVLLDVGSQDGVTEGSRFVIWRFPQTQAEQIAAFRVTKVDSWFSEAKLQDSLLRPDAFGSRIDPSIRVDLRVSEGRLTGRILGGPVKQGDTAVEDLRNPL